MRHALALCDSFHPPLPPAAPTPTVLLTIICRALSSLAWRIGGCILSHPAIALVSALRSRLDMASSRRALAFCSISMRRIRASASCTTGMCAPLLGSSFTCEMRASRREEQRRRHSKRGVRMNMSEMGAQELGYHHVFETLYFRVYAPWYCCEEG